MKTLLYRTKKNFRNWLLPDKPLLELDKDIYEIAKKLITTSDTNLSIDPINMKYFIKSDKYKIFMVVEEKSIKLAHNNNYYDIHVEFRSSKKIIQLFEKIQQRRTKKMQDEIFSQMKSSITGLNQLLYAK